MPEWVGRTLSKVILLKRLGKGSLADVYLGHHTSLERLVAVKLLHTALAEDELLRQRFWSEIQGVAALHHPNILQVYDVDLIDGLPYIIMEYIDGPSLASYLRQQPATARGIPAETVARFALGLAAALDYAHLRGILHHDIRPANVLLRREAGPIDPTATLSLGVEPVLSDFGLAYTYNLHSGAQGDLNVNPYLSPEQRRGEPTDGRSDVYSLGVLLYEMLAGHPPFETPGISHAAPSSLDEPAPSLPGTPPALQEVLAHALAQVPAKRYSRPGELAVALLVAAFPQALGITSPANLQYPQLSTLVERLELLVAQARTYARALPANNAAALTLASMLGDLARQALNEAQDLAAALRPAPSAPRPFSPREVQVLGLAAGGLTNKEIAYRLGISERTIQFHLNSIFNKTGAQSRTEAVGLALKHGWIDIPG